MIPSRRISALAPKPTPSSLIEKIETGLGDAGNLAIRRLPEEVKPSTNLQKPKLLWLPWVGMGVAATFIISSLSFYLIKSGAIHEIAPVVMEAESNPDGLIEDPESPIHGVSVAELEKRSGMPVGGWMPIFKEKFVDRIDEGVVSRPSGVPARQVRMRYLDEILWQHPATETRILSTQPRQEIILIDLDLY